MAPRAATSTLTKCLFLWSLRGSNPRHLQCKWSALPAELSDRSGPKRTRTSTPYGIRFWSVRVYQFHHRPAFQSAGLPWAKPKCERERTWTSTGFLPQPPQGCAYPSFATRSNPTLLSHVRFKLKSAWKAIIAFQYKTYKIKWWILNSVPNVTYKSLCPNFTEENQESDQETIMKFVRSVLNYAVESITKTPENINSSWSKSELENIKSRAG